MGIPNETFMTGYEKRLVKGMKKSDGDRTKEERMLMNTLKRVLGQDIQEELPTGERVNVSVGDLMVVKKVAYDLENPKGIDLVAYSKVMGESQVEVKGEIKGADALFGDIVIKGEDGDNSGK